MLQKSFQLLLSLINDFALQIREDNDFERLQMIGNMKVVLPKMGQLSFNHQLDFKEDCFKQRLRNRAATNVRKVKFN